MLDQYKLLKAKTVRIPMQEGLLLPYEKDASISKKIKYTNKIGSIIYVIVETCINIIFETSMISRFSTNPGPEYFNTVN